MQAENQTLKVNHNLVITAITVIWVSACLFYTCFTSSCKGNMKPLWSRGHMTGEYKDK